MKDLLRDTLEAQILLDAAQGDTTVLAELLTKLDDRYIYNCLGDEHQKKFPQFKFYYEIHVVGRNGFSTSVISETELDDDDVIMLGYEQDKLEGDDCHYVDYVQELSYDEWNEMFNPNGEPMYMCGNCGGGFTCDEIISYDDDTDLCIGCSGD